MSHNTLLHSHLSSIEIAAAAAIQNSDDENQFHAIFQKRLLLCAEFQINMQSPIQPIKILASQPNYYNQ